MIDTPAALFEERVDAVIAAYLEAERAGQAPDPEELLARHPDLADELQAFFSDHESLVQMLTPWAAPGNRPQAASTPTVDVGRYIGLEPHARGGLGEVFTASDTELHRTVAVKRLQDRHADNATSRRRFLLEAEVTARLEHPGIVPVHGMFRDERDRPCYAMRFIEGQTLADALRAYHAGPPDPLAFRRLLQSFIQVCQTVAYGHSRGVIHRDLKPQNIMLGKFGETLVVDWGLAKVVGRPDEVRSTSAEATLRPKGSGSSTDEQTEMGAAVGTPAYMSPEQAAGRWDVVDGASDVYGLGAVLYTLLTGRAPFASDNWPALQQQIQQGDFPRPRAVKPAVPRALEAICLKAMTQKPANRYASPQALAAEVENWLADEPVQAYREPLATRMGRWGRRHKPAVAASIALVTTAVIALATSAWFVSIEQIKADQAEAAKKTFQRQDIHMYEQNWLLQDRLRDLEQKRKAAEK